MITDQMFPAKHPSNKYFSTTVRELSVFKCDRQTLTHIASALASNASDSLSAAMPVCDAEERERLGLTQEEIAKRIDVHRLTIIRYESGESPIPKAVEMALRIIEAEEKE